MHPTDFDEPQVVPGVLVPRLTDRDTLRAWMVLWLVYNGVMLVAGGAVLLLNIHVVAHDPINLIGTLILTAIFAACANGCFCLGPIAELLIARWYPPETCLRARHVLFGAGLAFSLAVVAFVAVQIASAPPGVGGGGFNS